MPTIVQLKTCLYGLPQASKYFDDHLSETLLNIGFKRCITDSEVFILSRAGEVVYLTKHVDDILLAGPKKSELIPIISAELAKDYTLTTDFEPKTFVGLVIHRDRPSRSLTITQPHYVASLIDKYSIPSSSAKYPMSEDFLTNMPLPSADSCLFFFGQTKLIGSLKATSHIPILIIIRQYTPSASYNY